MNHNEEVPDFLGPCSSMPLAASMWINSLILEPTPALQGLTPYPPLQLARGNAQGARRKGRCPQKELAMGKAQGAGRKVTYTRQRHNAKKSASESASHC